MAKDRFNFGKLEKRARGAMEASLVLIGNEAKNHFVKSFKDGGFTDSALKRWKPRKKNDKRRPGRGVLIDSGDLRRSIRRKGFSRRALEVIIATDLPYASVHNFGERSGRGAGFKMPKRQFIGHSKRLNRNVERIIVRNLDKIFR